MPPQWLVVGAWVSLAAAVLTAAAVAVDIHFFGRRQKMAVMDVVWPVTALYTGPPTFWVYWRLGRRHQDRREEAGAEGEGRGGASPERSTPMSRRGGDDRGA